MKPAIFKSTYHAHGKQRSHTAINLPQLQGVDYSGLPEKILVGWKVKRGELPYVDYDVLAKEIKEPVEAVVAQLKAIWQRDRDAVAFTCDRMGNNCAFKIKKPEVFVSG